MHMQIVFPQLELHSIESSFENVPHDHADHYQMTIPLRGSCRFTHAGKERELAAGEGLLLPPRDRHYFVQGPEDGVVIFIIRDSSLYPADTRSFTEPPPQANFDPLSVAAFLQQWSSTLFGLGTVERMALEEKEIQALDFVHGLIWGGRQIRSGDGKFGSDEPSAARLRQTGPMKQVLDYIHACYTEPISIEQLAAIALQSRYHFIRSFKAATGQTPYQYVLRLRIREAKQRLESTAASVTDISYALGFSSPSQFYRAFVKAVSATPEQYRRQSR